ncbi:MAG: substrate-binding domain-containing protein [Candidatus Didemnitutus sp.]|nr:substrate-binding domain-containing protein [Candidatus Didemnitutus sp.]
MRFPIQKFACWLARLGKEGRLFTVAGLASLTGLAQTEIRLTGSDLLGPEFGAAIEQFAREQEISVSAEFAGSRPGIEQLRQGEADVGLFALIPGEEPPGEPLLSRVIAYQAVVVVVPDALPLTEITHGQLHGIFAVGGTDSFSSWGALGLTGEWRTRAIAPHALAPTAGLVVPLVRRLIFQGAEFRPVVQLAADADQVAQRTRSADNSIALTVGWPAPDSGLRVLAVARSVTEPAYLPIPEHLELSYPLRLPLYLTIRPAAAPRLQAFLKFLLSAEGGAAFAQAHFQLLPEGPRNQLILELEVLR